MKVVTDESQPKRPKGRVRRLRTVAVFPTMLTLGNLLCGFAAIYFCMRGLYSADIDPALKVTFSSKRLEEFLPTFISVGGFLVFLGMFFDLLDGRVARMTSGTTNFGGQLDSLADMVTFGIAPAFLMIGLVTLATHTRGANPSAARPPAVVQAAPADAPAVPTTHLRTRTPAAMPGPGFADAPAVQTTHLRPDDMLVSSRGAWMAGAIFAACCALRLARYNVEHSEADNKQRSFLGLPSPGGAAAVASLVILYEHVAEIRGWWLVNLLPGITIVAGLLMVSRVRYAHVGNRYLRGRKPVGFVVLMLVIAGMFMVWPAPTLTSITCLYALSGPAIWSVQRLRAHRATDNPAPVATTPDTHQRIDRAIP